MFDLDSCARKNILQLKPYRCARDDFKDDGTNILLDANENSVGPGLDVAALGAAAGQRQPLPLAIDRLNRYPDPHQTELKQLICDLRNAEAARDAPPAPATTAPTPLTPSNLFVGVGSDEAIDSLIRCFCSPGGADAILVCPPTYGMYSVSAHINDVPVLEVPLLPADQGFQLDVPAIEAALARTDVRVKLAFFCSPGNPTGALLSRDSLLPFLSPPPGSPVAAAGWNGVVVVDEAYIDFAARPGAASFGPLVNSFPNVVVLQTLSKAFGLAGLRIGAALAPAPVARLLNALKPPYNIAAPSSALAVAALGDAAHRAVSRAAVADLLARRAALVAGLARIAGVGRVRGGLAANFVLVEILDGPATAAEFERSLAAAAAGIRVGPSNEVARRVYSKLAREEGVVVRFRGDEHGCTGCLRITVGTAEQQERLFSRLAAVLADEFCRS